MNRAVCPFCQRVIAVRSAPPYFYAHRSGKVGATICEGSRQGIRGAVGSEVPESAMTADDVKKPRVVLGHLLDETGAHPSRTVASPDGPKRVNTAEVRCRVCGRRWRGKGFVLGWCDK